MITKQFALNAEMAYKRNDGHATIAMASDQRLECLFVWILVRREVVLLMVQWHCCAECATLRAAVDGKMSSLLPRLLGSSPHHAGLFLGTET